MGNQTMTALSFPLSFTAALLAGLLTGILLRDRAASPRARTLFALFFASVGVLALLAGLRFGYRSVLAGTLRPILAMTPGPLSYLAFRALTATEPRPWRQDLVRHFWPVPLAAALVFLGSPPVDLAIVASFVAYAILLARMRAQGPDVFVNTSLGDAARMLRLLSAVIALHLLSAAVDMAVFVDFAIGSGAEVRLILGAANVVLIAALAWVLLIRPDRDGVSHHGPEQEAPEPAIASAEDTALLAELEALMTTQRLYRDPGLTIARLARRAGVPARRVSQAINRSFGLNVSQFINGHRVAEAQRLLLQTARPVTDIMLEAGFQTKSNFNREFRRVTGDSPSGWREANPRRASG